MRITKKEIYYTYRKVKRELFQSKDTVYFDRIVEFENNFDQNIEKLYKTLNRNIIKVNDFEVGERFFNLKKIEIDNGVNKVNCKLFNSPIETLSAEIDYPKGYEPKIKNVEFRSFGDLSVEFQIIAGLWINHVGYEYEKKMKPNSYGNRLKEVKKVHNFTENHNYYKPYFKEYKNWQEDLIDHVTECICSNDVIVINTDFKNFFPEVDLHLLKELVNNDNLEYNWLTNLLFDLIDKFNNKYQNKGLPLNLLCSSSLANIYLQSFDDFVLNKINPLYYGRYVDDVLIALDANEDLAKLLLNNQNNYLEIFYEEIQNELSKFKLGLNAEKSKFFLLNKGDKNKFKQLKEHINKTSSEWRLIPSTEKYNDASNRLGSLFSDGYNNSQLVNLKETYNVSTRRNYFIKEILNFEKTYFIINEDVWRKRLVNFFESLIDIIFDLENFFTFQKHLPRLIGLLFQTRNFKLIETFLSKLEQILNYIDNNCKEKDKFLSFRKHFHKKTNEFISYFTPCTIKHVLYIKELRNDFELKNKKYFSSDLHFEPLFHSFYKYNEYQVYLQNSYINLDCNDLELSNDEKNFISTNLMSNSCSKKVEEYDCECEICTELYDTIGFYFFTRRITLLELSIAFKNKIIDKEDRQIFHQIANKFYSKLNSNNIDFNESISSFDKDIKIKEIELINQDRKKNSKVVICNTHFLTKNDSFTHTLQSLPEGDHTRVDRIINLVNDILKCEEKIDYLVFHELSIPRNLYLRLAQNLSFANINLIAGLEYQFDSKNKTLDNQLVYVLKVNDEYCESVALYHSKVLPAIHEGKEINNSIGYTMKPSYMDKLIIKHNDFYFSGMICNDLINQENRCFLRGKIDFLFVVAWNTDIGMYEHLIKTTSFDNHCYVLLCNNRTYGDSHIFVPYSENYKRYLQRINGGKRDNFMISEIDLVELRKFQINVISPEKPFKPIPTGFKISDSRKRSLYKLLR